MSGKYSIQCYTPVVEEEKLYYDSYEEVSDIVDKLSMENPGKLYAIEVEGETLNYQIG